MSSLKITYNEKIAPQLKESLGIKSVMSVPKIRKVTVNSGLSAKRDAKFIDTIVETLRDITGQQPVQSKARKSIAGFKIREGMVLGAMVTLRGERMWSFIDKLVNVVFPRIRDFRGIPESSVDRDGNFNYGFREHLAFPEVQPDAVDRVHGLQVTITTTAKTHEEGLALFKALGFPFIKKDSGK